jgi:hypothetical protein
VVHLPHENTGTRYFFRAQQLIPEVAVNRVSRVRLSLVDVVDPSLIQRKETGWLVVPICSQALRWLHPAAALWASRAFKTQS